jgi:hypothetical protein
MNVMKLLNIRLDPSDVARVRALRARGVEDDAVFADKIGRAIQLLCIRTRRI